MQNLNSPKFQRGLRAVPQEPGTMITMALIGAATGAVTAAITGGSILKGALMGAIGGAITAGVGPMLSGLAGGASTAAAATAAGADAAVASAGQLATAGGGDILAGLDAGAGASGGAGGASGMDLAADGGANAPNMAPTSTPGTGMAQGTGGTGMMGSAPPDTGIGGGAPGQTGMGGPMPSNTGMASVPPNPAAATGSGNFLDDLLNKGKSMLGGVNSKQVLDVGGRMLAGYAQGNTEQAKLDARAAEIAKARENARFGSTGSRYNTAGMIGATPTYKA